MAGDSGDDATRHRARSPVRPDGDSDQSATIAFLASPAAHGGLEVERIDTHASIVFLAGDRALKLKRAVRYDYLDFSTVERRRDMCAAEFRLNHAIAPAIYRGVLPVTRDPHGALSLGGDREPVDWVVEMARFDQSGLFDRLAASGRLDIALMGPLADAIAAFHAAAAKRPDHGGARAMARVIEGNARGFREEGAGILDGGACERATSRSHEVLERVAPLLDRRRAAGFVRQCHGDLHLRNIVRLDGRPTLFDAIEFNDDLSCIDVLYDLAFLLMDLWRRELPHHANAVFNACLSRSKDWGALSLLPLFLSCRAGVRAKTSATAARLQPEPARQRELQGLAREYLQMAARLLDPPVPGLVAVGGLSGTGKSVLARALAPDVGAVPGAVVVRSDEIRKELRDVPALVRLPEDAYTAAVSRDVYRTIATRASVAAAAGHSVIADAVYTRPEDRQMIEAVATSLGIPFVGIWLEASERTLIERVEARRLDASDADASVVRLQRSTDPGEITWRRIDADRGPQEVQAEAFASIERAVL